MATRLPLEGMRVLDCCQILSGPFCTMLLADMGADVIRVEKPDGGDDTRRIGPLLGGVDSAAHILVNRNKRSVVVDIKAKEGRDIILRLAANSDVMIENMRTGTMARLGLGYDDVREVNPALIYCSISGFGITGPYKDRAGFDVVAQGMSGLMSLTGFPGMPPARVGVPIGDLNAGIYAAYGILCAYVNRLKTGQGQFLDTSLFESTMAYIFWDSALMLATGEVPGPVGSASRLASPHQAYRTADGYINIGAANQSTWQRMCRAMDRQDLLCEPRYATVGHRMANIEELTRSLEETLSRKSTAEWLRILEDGGVPAGPIRNMAEVFSDPQVLARDMIVEQEHPHAGMVKHVGIPVKLSETPGSIRTPAPLLGQHTDEVLASCGYSAQEIAAFRERGVVR